jgi:hypothetical protein
VIEAALGHDLAKGIPALLRLADLHVRIPRFVILALERLAERDGKSVDAVLARELLDVVSAESVYPSGEEPSLHSRAALATEVGRIGVYVANPFTVGIAPTERS